MASEKTATFGIKIPVETNADEAALSVDALRKKIAESQGAIKQFTATQRALRGTTDEVKDAKAKLTAAVNAEKDAVSRATLSLGRHNVALVDLSKKSKGAGGSLDAFRAGLAKMGGPANDVTEKVSSLTSVLKGENAGMLLAAGGTALAAAGLVAFAAAAIAGGVALAKLTVESANELRSMNLAREAALGSAANAKNFGDQIEEIARVVPLSRAQLQGLTLDVGKSFIGARISGQGIQDVFEAVAHTSSAMGDSTGKALQGILEKGKMVGRLSIGRNELQGTGIEFTDVAAQLAKNLKIGIKAAQQQLLTGRAKLDAGAYAVAQVVKTRFASINLQKTLDIGHIAQRFKDNITGLFSGVEIKPFLNELSKLANLFNKDTVQGAALKDLLKGFGKLLNLGAEEGSSVAEDLMNDLILAALNLQIEILELKASWVGLQEKWNSNAIVKVVTDLTSGTNGVVLLRSAVAALTIGMGFLGAAVLSATWPFVSMAALIGTIILSFNYLVANIGGIDWDFLGTNIMNGLVGGLTSAWEAAKGAVTGIVDKIKKIFTGGLDMHSPSKVFEKYGEYTVEGYAGGVKGSSSKAESAVAGMLGKGSPIGGGGGNGKGGGSTSVTVSLNFPNAKSGPEIMSALTSPSFKAQLTQTLEEILMGAAVPTQKEAA